jgi:hypothetical protein
MRRESPADLAAPLIKRRRRVQVGPLTLLFELYHDRGRRPKLFQPDKNYLANPVFQLILQTYLGDRAIERTLKMRQASSMRINLRCRPRTVSIVLALLPILAAVAELPALAAEPFHYPAVLRSGKKIGDLVPGLSALADVVKMFPAPPQDYPGNPRPPAGFPEVKIGKVQPEPATVYNPPETSYALFFDDNDKLVIIEDAHSPLAGLGPEAIHRRYPKLKDTGHDERVIELQGQIEPCIVMMVLFSAQTRKVTRVAYAFTCPTSGSQSTRRDEIPPC